MTSIFQPSSISIAIILIVVASYCILQASPFLGPIMGLTDHPDWRKKHASGIPTTGSFALLASLILFALWYLNDTDMVIILIGAGLFYLLGLVDDIKPLPAMFKLVYQVIVATTVAAQTELTVLNMEFLRHFETFDAIPFATLSIAVALTILLSNAFNFIDGHDGVAAGISIFTILAIVPAYWPDLNSQIALLSIFITLPMLVFWVQNSGLIGRKLFLGDSGSLTLGYLVSWMIIYQLNQPSASLSNYNHLTYFLWVILIPCADALAVLLHRAWVKKPIFQPDRSHLHHLLTDAGINSISVMVLVLLLHATFIGSGWLVMQYIPQWSYLLLTITTLGYIVTTHRYRNRSIID